MKSAYPLPSSSNYRLCETRLKTFHYKLKNESNPFTDYHEIIKKSRESLRESMNLLILPIQEYIAHPHQAVIRKERETKVRVVYDGSAKQSNDY